MRIAGRIAALVVLWLLAWGDLSVAIVLSGIAVAAALLLAFPPEPAAGVRFHPLGIARLLGYVAAQLVTSNVVMAGQIVRKRPTNAPGVLAHRLQRPSEEIMTVMTTVIALSPGTMTVDTSRDSSVVYVHFLLLLDVAAARESLVRLERLVVGAIGPAPLRRDGPPGPEELP